MFQEKPFAPTANRRERARRDGHVPRGRDLTPVAVLLVGLAAVLWAGPSLSTKLGNAIRAGVDSVNHPESLEITSDDALQAGRSALFSTMALGLPFFLAAWLAAAVSQWGQVGWNWLPQRVVPKFSRVDPVQGMSRMFQPGRFADGILATIRLVTGGLVIVSSLWIVRDDLVSFGNPVTGIASVTLAALWVLVTAAAALAIIAVGEYGFRWWVHENEMRMTAEEMRAESRGQSGDMKVRALQRGTHQQLVRRKQPETLQHDTRRESDES